MTLKHPLFDVGPGNFPAALYDEFMKKGRTVAWMEPHNSYTQVSSECGLPALFFYASTLLTCLFRTTFIFRKFRNAQNPRHSEIAAMAFALRASLIAFGVTAMFSSVAYQALLPSLAGLSIAFVSSVREDLEELRMAQTVPVADQRPAAAPQPAMGARWPLQPAARSGIRRQAS